MWLAAILVDRAIDQHFHTAVAHCEREDVPTHMDCQH
jgi:hypothetical protein